MSAANHFRSSSEATMNCMEVCGGRGTGDAYFSRPGLDVWVWSHSQEQTEAGGGDLHLISSCASGRVTRMLMADVCGYGSLFTEIAHTLRDLVKQNVNAVRQGKIIRDLSRRLDGPSQRGGFASMLISTYFAPTRSFSLCNTGYPPPLLFRAHEGTWSVLKAAPRQTKVHQHENGLVHPDEYQHFDTTLQMNDMVLTYSNALTECRDGRGGIIGVEGVCRRVTDLAAGEPAQLIRDLVRQITGAHVENLSSDDATLMLCRATDRSVTWHDNLMSPFRLFREVADKTKLD